MNRYWRAATLGLVTAVAFGVGCTDDDGPDVTPLTAQDLQDSMTIPNSTPHQGSLPAGTSDASAPQVTNIDMPETIVLGQSFQVTVQFHTGVETLAKLLVQIEGADGYLELTMSAVPNTDGEVSFPCVISSPSGALSFYGATAGGGTAGGSSGFALIVQLGDSTGTYGAQVSEPITVEGQVPSGGGGGGGDSVVMPGDGSAGGGDAGLPGADASAMGCSYEGAPCTETMFDLEGHCWDGEMSLECAADCNVAMLGGDCADSRSGTCYHYPFGDGEVLFICHAAGSVAADPVDGACPNWYDCVPGAACVSGNCRAICTYPAGSECIDYPSTTCVQSMYGFGYCEPT